MTSLNTSTNGPNITRSYQSIVNSPLPTGSQANSPTFARWAVFTIQAPLESAFQHAGNKESVLKVQSTGEGELEELIEEFSEGRIQFAFVKVKDPNTTLPKCVLIAWCGGSVPERTKGYFGSHLGVVAKLLHGYHVQVTARSDQDLTPEKIIQKVADSSGSKYAGGPAIPSSAAPPPIAAKKPVFTPTQFGGGGRGFQPLASRTKGPVSSDGNVDDDGWGADAPPVTRTQLEKVQSAYQPTKVNISDLTSNKPEPSRFQPKEPTPTPSDVVKGGYQPIGKVDIAALRRQAQKSSQDDRPAPVKGAYEPVGKVDIAAIRAKAGGPSPSSRLSPAATGASNRSNEDESPKPLSERSAAFQQSERLTTLPKPKVANKFGGASAFTGTKAPTPSGFGAKPAAPAAPVGSASRTFADEGGKTPHQLWLEKKQREGGGAPIVSPSSTGDARPPLSSQKSGGGGWQSGYTGKSWAPVQTTHTGKSAGSNISAQRTGEEHQPEEPSSPSGGVSALKDRFKGAAPMGAPPAPRAVPEPQQMPPPMDFSSKPNAGARVPIPGLPNRPSAEEIPPVQHQRVPSPPPQPPRSPTPEPESPQPTGSPVRIAMPVARGRSPELSPAEQHPPAMPTRSLEKAVNQARDLSPEPAKDPARGAGVAAAAATFGVGTAAVAAVAASHSQQSQGKRAVVEYDYEKAEDNEIDLREGDYVTNIDMVDDDWWMGQNADGETGLFPSNYVKLVEDNEDDAGSEAPPPLPSHPSAAQHQEEEAPPAPAAPASKGPTATALYDYEAAEDNEISFPENATITSVEFPDEDWWLGTYNGHTGLFPANYVELDK